MVLNTSLNVNREPIVETPIDALICAFGTAIDFLYLEGLLVDCPQYATPGDGGAPHRRSRADAGRGVGPWSRARHLTRYDAGGARRVAGGGEQDRGVAPRVSSQVRARAAAGGAGRPAARGSSIIGTRGHTRCLYEYVDGFAGLDVAAFVPMDDQPGRARGSARLSARPSLDAVDWSAVDAVLVSTHEYQALALAAGRGARARRAPTCSRCTTTPATACCTCCPERWAW